MRSRKMKRSTTGGARALNAMSVVVLMLMMADVDHVDHHDEFDDDDAGDDECDEVGDDDAAGFLRTRRSLLVHLLKRALLV